MEEACFEPGCDQNRPCAPMALFRQSLRRLASFFAIEFADSLQLSMVGSRGALCITAFRYLIKRKGLDFDPGYLFRSLLFIHEKFEFVSIFLKRDTSVGRLRRNKMLGSN